MKLKQTFFMLMLTAVLSACSGNGSIVEQIQETAGAVLANSDTLSSADITAGLKEALSKGTNTVVGQLGQSGGFNGDDLIRIPLPESLQKARSYAAKVGLNKPFDQLEDKLNEAAEKATPKAKDLFVGAIKDMGVDDAKGILQGGDDAATRYFEGKMSSRLQEEMRPIVSSSLDEVGAVRSFNSLMKSYKRIPGAPEINADLTQHVVDGGVKGIFHYVAEQEKDIRENPAARTTELLQRVFAAQ